MSFADNKTGVALISLNGERHEIPTGMTITALLDRLAIDPRLVVVERNREILRDRTVFSEVVLVDGDTVEVVHFVGGG